MGNSDKSAHPGYSSRSGQSRSKSYSLAMGLTFFTAFLLTWMGLGVGVIGADGDAANLMYGGVFAIGIAGAIITRREPAGMSHTLMAMAGAQMLVALIALAMGMHQAEHSSVGEIIGANAFFAAFWIAAGLLFRHAAIHPTQAPPGPA